MLMCESPTAGPAGQPPAASDIHGLPTISRIASECVTHENLLVVGIQAQERPKMNASGHVIVDFSDGSI